jgi:hypothetical protein
MSSVYDPEVKIYYGPLDSDHRLIPAPNISILLEYQYSNDTIIGYSYIINLSGLATALDLRELNNGDPIPESPQYNSGAVIDHIHKLRKILTQNGNILNIVDKDNNAILKAKGGILRSLTFDESPNNLVHSTPYTASIEFNSVDLGDKTEDCSSIFLDAATFNPEGIADIQKFKIKSFEDSWSFTFDENESFNRVKLNDVNNNLNINNHTFNIEYSINAVGKHFFAYTDEATGESTLLPAWEQAKNFVQYRLYDQVTHLITNVLKDSYASACSSSDGLDDILEPGSSGLMKGLGDSNYKIFNEQISCEASESDGSFSAKYNAIVKSTRGNTAWSSPNTRHTIQKSVTNTTETSGQNNMVISLNGTIEGLIEGGLIRINEPIQLPQSGSLFISANQSNNKYSNAKTLLDQIYNESDYGAGLGECGKRDLKPFFKSVLGITLDAFNASSNPNDCVPDPPHPTSFNLTHDYNNGTINYSIEYSKSRACGRKFTDISIQTNNSNKIFATFNIPNSYNCPTIQELGTYSAKKVTLTVKGIDGSEIGQPTDLDITQEVVNTLSLGCYNWGYLPITMPPPGTYIITQKQYTRNPIDGSFTVIISYICDTTGCSI